MGIIKKVFGKKNKSDAELKADVLKKATDHWNENSELTDVNDPNKHDSLFKKDMPVYEANDQLKKKNIRSVLLEIASRGEAGVLSISISDKVSISQPDTSTALGYLSKNNYVESVNSAAGMKYFLTDIGKKFCISKNFNSNF